MIELAPAFQAVQDVMEQNRLAFNQADTLNANHGEHMVEIFAVAVRAVKQTQADGLAAAMDKASLYLGDLTNNGSAQVYAHGLAQFGLQFHKYELRPEDLESYLHKALKEETSQPVSPYFPAPATQDDEASSARSGDVLKALLAALAGWQQIESGDTKPASPLDLGYMFDLGIAYMRAKQRNTAKIEVIADAAASVSPLNKVPYRYQSGKLAIRTLLEKLVNINPQDT